MILEQLGLAPFSVENVKVDDEELLVDGSPSTSTYSISLLLLFLVSV